MKHYFFETPRSAYTQIIKMKCSTFASIFGFFRGGNSRDPPPVLANYGERHWPSISLFGPSKCVEPLSHSMVSRNSERSGSDTYFPCTASSG